MDEYKTTDSPDSTFSISFDKSLSEFSQSAAEYNVVASIMSAPNVQMSFLKTVRPVPAARRDMKWVSLRSAREIVWVVLICKDSASNLIQRIFSSPDKLWNCSRLRSCSWRLLRRCVSQAEQTLRSLFMSRKIGGFLTMNATRTSCQLYNRLGKVISDWQLGGSTDRIHGGRYNVVDYPNIWGIFNPSHKELFV